MQSPPVEVWVALGAGAAALAVVLIVLLVRRRRRASAPGSADPAEARTVPERDGEVAAEGRESPGRPRTVADAVARRAERDTRAGAEPQAGSDAALAAAVTQALAARTVRRPGTPSPAPRTVPVDPAPPSEPRAGPRATPPETGSGGSARGDVRDRLLAVLLADPVRAVGATAELDLCRTQVERLTEALHHERVRLADVLRRLRGSGLDQAQLARLARLPVEEVADLLASEDAAVSPPPG